MQDVLKRSQYDRVWSERTQAGGKPNVVQRFQLATLRTIKGCIAEETAGQTAATGTPQSTLGNDVFLSLLHLKHGGGALSSGYFEYYVVSHYMVNCFSCQ